jgi:adenosylcobinamide-phosphate guanylyltransferase
MCGGRGTRLGGDTEKPLVGVGGRPMVDRVCSAFLDGRVGAVHCAVSPHTPETRAHLADRPDVSVIETPGEGYVADLGDALERVGTPVVTAASDLPLLTPEAVGTALDAAGAGGAEDAGGADDAGGGSHAADDAGGVDDADAVSVTVCVLVELKRELGVSVDTATDHAGRRVAPTGLNVVGDRRPESEGDDGEAERTLVVDDERLAVNVNRPRDLRIADHLLEHGRDPDHTHT